MDLSVSDESQQSLPVNSRIRVKAGVTFPEAPEQDISGWEGTILRVVSTDGETFCLVEWLPEVIEMMSDELIQTCRQQQLSPEMAFVVARHVEIMQE